MLLGQSTEGNRCARSSNHWNRCIFMLDATVTRGWTRCNTPMTIVYGRNCVTMCINLYLAINVAGRTFCCFRFYRVVSILLICDSKNDVCANGKHHALFSNPFRCSISLHVMCNCHECYWWHLEQPSNHKKSIYCLCFVKCKTWRHHGKNNTTTNALLTKLQRITV